MALFGWLTWLELDPPPRPSQGAPAASLGECQGDVRVRDPESLAWSRGRGGVALRAGDAVFAADGSSAVVTFTGGERLVLGPRSLVVIASPSEGAEAALRQGAAAAVGGGRVLVVRVAGARVQIPASSRVAIARATGGALEIFVERGGARVTTGANEPDRAVSTGRGLLVAGGTVSTPAGTATLEVPGGGEIIYADRDPEEPAPVEVAWAPAGPGDVVQISASPDFGPRTLAPADAPGRARVFLRPGAHMLRVAGADGEPRSSARFVVVASRRAPFPWQPAQGMRVAAGRSVPLFWTEVQGAVGYRLEVAQAEGPAISRFEAAVSPTTIDPLGPGRWRWRAAARFGERDGPWSGWAGFEVAEDLSVAPELQAPDLRVVPLEGEEAR
jgi:hypothetical protein